MIELRDGVPVVYTQPEFKKNDLRLLMKLVLAYGQELEPGERKQRNARRVARKLAILLGQ